MTKFIFLSLVMVSISLHGLAQNWEHYYPTNTYAIYGYALIQTYDNGYLLAINNNGGKRAKITKLDVNGNLIWTKEILCAAGYEIITDLCETPNGGIMVVGQSTCYDPANASFIMHLNSCGELQWLKEFGTFNSYDYINRVIPLLDGNYLVGASYLGGISSNNRVNLIKYDIFGNIIWQGNFTYNSGSSLVQITETVDSSIYVAGITFVADPGQITPVKLRTHLIKVNFDGDSLFEIPYGVNDSVISAGKDVIALNDSSMMILSIFRHPYWNLKYWNYIIKVDTSGQEIWKKFVSDTNSLSEDPIALIKISDTTAIILCNASYSYSFNTIYDTRLKAIKIDFDGNVLDSVQFGTGINEGLRATKNNDGDVVICGMHYVGNQTGAFAIKIRPDLQIDTLFNQLLSYDSLCAFPILTDTIIYDTTFVGIKEHFVKERKLKIFPNPTSGEVTIEYDSSLAEGTLEIYNTLGKLVKKVPLTLNEQKKTFSMGGISTGVYTVKVVGDGIYIDAIKLCLISN